MESRPVPVCVTVVNEAPGEPLELPDWDERPRRANEVGNNHRTQDLFQESSSDRKPRNEVVILYGHAFNAGAVRWLSAMAVLALSAAIISKQPSELLLVAAAFNLAIACLHVPLTGPGAKPVSLSNPRPPAWYILILLFSTVSWAVSMSFMFTVYSDKTHFPVADIDHSESVTPVPMGGIRVHTNLENITLACGCLGISTTLCCLYQWSIVFKLINGDFSEHDVAEAFLRKE